MCNAFENKIYSLLLTIEISKKNLHFFSSLRGPHEQSTSLHAFAIFATPWVPWQCEVLRNCAKDFWMPQSYAMGHALLDPHDASGEVLDNDSAFERQHGNQSETNRQPSIISIQIYPQLRSADFNPFNDLQYPWNFFDKTSRHYTKHFSHIWNLCQLMVSYIMNMGRIRLELHLSPIAFLLKHLIGV